MNYLKIFPYLIITAVIMNAENPILGEKPAYDIFERVPSSLRPVNTIEIELLEIFDETPLIPFKKNIEISDKLSKYEWFPLFIKHEYYLYDTLKKWNEFIYWDTPNTNLTQEEYHNAYLRLLVNEQNRIRIRYILKFHDTKKEVFIVGYSFYASDKTFEVDKDSTHGSVASALFKDKKGKWKIFANSGNGGHYYNHIIFNDQKSIMDTLNDMELISVNPFRWKYTPIALRN